MLLRLDPAIPRVWRDLRTLQFGVDPVHAVVDDVSPGLERLIAALEAGIADTAYAMLAATFGVPGDVATRLRTTLAPCLVTPQRRGEPGEQREPRRATVFGGSRLAHDIARVLDAAGMRMTQPGRPALVLLVADRVLSPADHRMWLQHDVAHLPVVVSDASIAIGPLVVPGVTPCLHCLDLHRRDADPAWPAIGAQLGALGPAPGNAMRAASATALACRIAASWLRGDGVGTIQWRVTDDGETVSERRVEPHPECRCSTPPESDWARAGDPAARAPTSVRQGSAVHA